MFIPHLFNFDGTYKFSLSHIADEVLKVQSFYQFCIENDELNEQQLFVDYKCTGRL